MLFYNRILSNDEILFLHADPFCMFASSEQEMPVAFSASPSFIPAWAQQTNLPVLGTGVY